MQPGYLKPWQHILILTSQYLLDIKVCGRDPRELCRSPQFSTGPDVCHIVIMVGHHFEVLCHLGELCTDTKGGGEDTDHFQQGRGSKESSDPEKMGDFASPWMFLLKPQRG